ncbi:MAG TPA: site-specific DNA-methyltransferase [Ignavibacteria bacterium]
MNGESLRITQDLLEKLKSVFPEIVTEGKIDWEKLQVSLGKENAEFSNERYVLNWAGKAEAFKVLQQSTTATLKPVNEESINFDTTENVFIEGENLEVLKVLQKAYYGKIKVIDIDPPYNTGSDSFIYPDSFKESREEYQKRIGEKDEEGYLMKEGFFRKNSKDSGHYHSNWLSMMYPRLFLAKNLLRDDGVIFVHIDDNEVHNLRMIMNEIFGEENFVGCFIWRKKEGGGQTDEFFVTEHEYILVFRKSSKFNWQDEIGDDNETNYKLSDEKGKYKIVKLAKWGSGARKEDRPTMHFPIIAPDNTEILPKAPDGSAGRWRLGKKKMDLIIKSNSVHWERAKDEWLPYEKIYFDPNKGKTIKDRSILYNIANTGDGTNVLTELFRVKDIFDNPKPIELEIKFIENNVDDDEIVLDFFCGSASTAHAIIEQNMKDGINRKYILVQLPEETKENSVARLNGINTISELAIERIRRVIKKIENKKKEKPELFENGNLDLGFKVFKLSSSNFKIWRGSEITVDNLEIQLDAFTNPVKEGSETENMLYELILKAGYLLTDKVEYVIASGAKQSATNVIASKAKQSNEFGYYSINNGELIIALDKMNQKLIDKIISAKPKKVITLDKLFTGNDQLKTNTVLQMKDAEIDFKTI